MKTTKHNWLDKHIESQKDQKELLDSICTTEEVEQITELQELYQETVQAKLKAISKVYKEGMKTIYDAYNLEIAKADRVDFDRNNSVKAGQMREKARIQRDIDRDELNHAFTEAKLLLI